MHDDLKGFTLYAYVGRDELGSGEVGLKQGKVPAGYIPLVVIESDREKIERPFLRAQLQAQADRYRQTIRLVRFVAVEEILTIEPKGPDDV